MKIKKIINGIMRPARIYHYCSRRGWLNWMSDEAYVRKVYKLRVGRDLNLENPQTFNEKLQWLKLYDRNPQYTIFVDKYEVRKYIADTIGDEYLIPLLGVWNKFDEIDFEKLPDQFVLKCTHDSASVVICHDKKQFDKERARKKLNRCLKNNGYGYGREWPYKNVKPRIVAEKLLVDESDGDLKDYKFFCFGGTPKCFKIDFDRFVKHKANYYDVNGDLMPVGEVVCPPDFDKKLVLPSRLEDMKVLAATLSKGIPFLRVDFYEVNGKIYFGELTFYPASGFGPFTDFEWDVKFGSWIELPEKRAE